MHKTRRLADILRQVGRKGDDVMIGSFFDLIYPLDRECCLRLYYLNGVGGYRPHLGVNLTYRDLHIQPFLKLVLERPDRAHLGQCVTFYHCFLFSDGSAPVSNKILTSFQRLIKLGVMIKSNQNLFYRI